MIGEEGTPPLRTLARRCGAISLHQITMGGARENGFAGLHFWSAGSNGGIQNTLVYGNTVYNAYSCAVRFQNTDGQTGTALWNNIFMTVDGRTVVDGNPSTVVAKFEHNHYWCVGGALSLAGQSTLIAWQNATGQEKVNGTSTGLYADPLLTDAGGGSTIDDPAALADLSAYRLLGGSPCVNSGVTVALSGGRDFYGTTVPQGGRFDIGACERQDNTQARKAATRCYLANPAGTQTGLGAQLIDLTESPKDRRREEAVIVPGAHLRRATGHVTPLTFRQRHSRVARSRKAGQRAAPCMSRCLNVPPDMRHNGAPRADRDVQLPSTKETITMKKQLPPSSVLALLIALSCSTIFAQQITTSETDSIQVLAQGFVNLLSKEEFTAATKNFDAAMNAAMPPAELEQTWKSLLAQAGTFNRRLRVRKEKVQGYDVVFVSCEFGKLSLDVKVVFNSAKQIAGLFFVPTQAGPATQPPSVIQSPNDREVLIGKGEWAVHGTLSFPNGTGPFPAVVLVHGSGPNDRDETIGPNKPFRDLAQGLTSRGIAVLRYEKRTKEHATELAPLKDGMTVKEETIDDALVAVSALRGTDRINPKKVFVLGHSLGGMLIPRIGVLDSDIAGFIIMAGPSRPLEDIFLEQMTYLFSLGGAMSEDKKAQLAAIKRQVANVKDPKLSPATRSTELPLGIPAKYWLDLRGYNPPEVARSLKQPMLVVQGERDYQTTMENFAGWKKHLSAKSNAVFKSYPKLNHLFVEGEGKSTPQEYNVEGHVAEYVIQDIAAWITK